MSTLRTLKKLLLGETWILPIGLAVTLAAGGLLLRHGHWPHLGGFLLLAGVLVVLLASVNRSARLRSRASGLGDARAPGSQPADTSPVS